MRKKLRTLFLYPVVVLVAGVAFSAWLSLSSPLLDYFQQVQINDCCIQSTGTVVSIFAVDQTFNDPGPDVDRTVMLRASVPGAGVVEAVEVVAGPPVRIGQKFPVLIDKHDTSMYLTLWDHSLDNPGGLSAAGFYQPFTLIGGIMVSVFATACRLNPIASRRGQDTPPVKANQHLPRSGQFSGFQDT